MQSGQRDQKPEILDKGDHKESQGQLLPVVTINYIECFPALALSSQNVKMSSSIASCNNTPVPTSVRHDAMRHKQTLSKIAN